jgi:hypothetical protein
MPRLIRLAQVIHASEVRHGWRIFAPVLCHAVIVINNCDAGGLHQAEHQLKKIAIDQDTRPRKSLHIAALILCRRSNRKKIADFCRRRRYQPDGSADQSQACMEALEAGADRGGAGGAGVVGSRMARSAGRC